MSRTGIEEKPAWQRVPPAIRARVEQELRVDVVRGTRIWGGYGPTPTFRLTLADGTGAFLKGVNGESNEFARSALRREERNYRELGELIAPWAPRVRGAFQLDDWQVLLLDDLGPKSVPPWTPAKARAVAEGLAAFHRSTAGREFPDWLHRPSSYLQRLHWDRVALTTDDFRLVASLADQQSDAALTWFHQARPVLAVSAEKLAETPGPWVLAHGDVRSDNLRLVDRQLYLFDWPHVVVGPAEFDLVEFAQTVSVEGGPDPQQVVDWYDRSYAVRGAALDAAIAWWAAFFADNAWRPDIPGLPRLRQFQRQQLDVLLHWAARRFALPEPPWTTLSVTPSSNDSPMSGGSAS